MTVEADLYNSLKALVSDRVYPDIAPSGVAFPFITYQQVGGDIPSFMERSMPSKKNGYFQINVWATSRSEASNLILQAESAVCLSTSFQAEAQSGPIASYDETGKTYGMFQQFSIWSDR